MARPCRCYEIKSKMKYLGDSFYIIILCIIENSRFSFHCSRPIKIMLGNSSCIRTYQPIVINCYFDVKMGCT